MLVELSCSALEGWLSFFMANIMNHYVVLWKVGCFFMANVMNHYVVFWNSCQKLMREFFWMMKSVCFSLFQWQRNSSERLVCTFVRHQLPFLIQPCATIHTHVWVFMKPFQCYCSFDFYDIMELMLSVPFVSYNGWVVTHIRLVMFHVLLTEWWSCWCSPGLLLVYSYMVYIYATFLSLSVAVKPVSA